MTAAGVFFPSASIAQRPDTTKIRVPAVIIRGATPDSQVVDTPSVVKISPRRAFFTSLAFPGSMQLKFGRPKAATIFLVAEAGTGAMAAKSWHDLRVAKAARADTVLSPVVDVSGRPVLDSLGKQKTTSAPRNPNIADRVVARRTHLEDWLAGIVFTHLFAGADAFVAANLADFNTNLRVTSTGRGVRVLATVAW
ncbi:MAG: hypothetical protein ABIZ36_14610, partial [Gemmatimonadaceae bacterium]